MNQNRGLNSLDNYLKQIEEKNYRKDFYPNVDQDKTEEYIKKLENVIKKFEQNSKRKFVNKKSENIIKEIQEICEVVYSYLEESSIYIEPLKKNKLYNYLFRANNCKYIYIQKNSEFKIDQLNKKIDEATAKVDKNVKEIDNIWGNVISVVLSISMVAALVSGLDKINKEFILVFSCIIIWIGMTLLLFFSNLFDNKNLGTQTSKKMYNIFSIVTIIVTLISLAYAFYPYLNLIKTNKNDNKCSDIPFFENTK